MKTYDVVIIGAGPGGYVAAIRAGQKGAKVALVEKEDIGGVCLNYGCIPTKALLKSAQTYKEALEAKEFGVLIDKENIRIDWSQMVKRKDRIVKRLTGGVKLLLKNNNVDVYQGYGDVVDKNTVKVNDETLSAKNIILATGASPIIPPIPGVKEAFEDGIIATSKELLSLKELPKKLAIIGGGVIGVEFATIFSTLGVEVNIIEREDNILLNIDDEVRDTYLRILKKAKINIHTNSEVTKVNKNTITYKHNGEEKTLTGDKILMSVGMRPNTDSFNNLNLETTKTGIKVNEKLETSVKGIYAIGDLNGNLMLAHVASAEGIIAVDNILGANKTIDYNKAPSGIYGFPEIAMVGLTERQAKEQNLDFKVSKFPLSANGKALADNSTEGFVKIISDKKYGEILGMHILSPHATDMISEAVVTMELEGTVYEIANAIHPHPTVSEAIMEAAHGAIDKAIHIL